MKCLKNKQLVIIAIIVFIITIFYFANEYFFVPYKPNIDKLFINNKNEIEVNFSLTKLKYDKKVYCMVLKEKKTPTLSSKKWVLASNNKCTFNIDSETYYLFLKNSKGIYFIDKSDTLGKIISFDINKEKVYLAINGTYQIKPDIKYIGNANKTVTYESSDPGIASVSPDGLITGVKNGTVNIVAKCGDYSKKIEVISTNVIVKRPNNFDFNKKYLPCEKYNKTEADLLDTILYDRVESVGYKTRASVVEAARFLTLELPYRLNYFSENGRLTYPAKIDGEGRYYHKGLYLHSSKFSIIGNKSQGPEIWGCNMYNRVSHRTSKNGFDCSGFVSWVLLNGGFDPGDIGAGVTSVYDLTDTGKKTKFNQKVVDSKVVKTGDLLSSGGVQGGHIAIIVGQDDNNYYVAESLWTGTTGVVVKTYKKNKIYNRYYWVILMDSYYKEDGDYTVHWH